MSEVERSGDLPIPPICRMPIIRAQQSWDMEQDICIPMSIKIIM